MSEPTVHQRLISVLTELPAIGKDQRNAQQGFMFRGHDDILNALNPLLSKHGVVVVPDVVERVTSQRTTSKGGVMYEVNLHVRFRFYGAGGDHIEASTWGEGTDSGDKATNKAMTMAFKNVLNQTFAISSAEFKDADADTPEATEGRVQASESASNGTKAEGWPRVSELLEKLEAALPTQDGQNSHAVEIRMWSESKFGKKSHQLTPDEVAEVVKECEHRLKEADVPF